MKNNVASSAPRSIAAGVTVVTLAICAAAATNALIFYRTPPLTTELEGGEVRYYPTEIGDIFYQRSGSGPAMLLIHGIAAGESSYEFRKVWKALAATNTVYALDLVGFGKSDKPPIDYDAETYIGLIGDFVRDVVCGADGNHSTAVVASSLSAAFVVAAAERDQTHFNRLVLICPTGINELASPVSALGIFRRSLLRTPVLGTTLYNMIASKRFIRGYLKSKIYASASSVNDAVVDHYHVSAHQIGGERVLPSFVTGCLNISIADALRRLTMPVTIVWGREARQSPLTRSAAFLDALGGRASRVVIDRAGMLPHEEQPAAFVRALSG